MKIGKYVVMVSKHSSKSGVWPDFVWDFFFIPKITKTGSVFSRQGAMIQIVHGFHLLTMFKISS